MSILEEQSQIPYNESKIQFLISAILKNNSNLLKLNIYNKSDPAINLYLIDELYSKYLETNYLLVSYLDKKDLNRSQKIVSDNLELLGVLHKCCTHPLHGVWGNSCQYGESFMQYTLFTLGKIYDYFYNSSFAAPIQSNVYDYINHYKQFMSASQIFSDHEKPVYIQLLMDDLAKNYGLYNILSKAVCGIICQYAMPDTSNLTIDRATLMNSLRPRIKWGMFLEQIEEDIVNIEENIVNIDELDKKKQAFLEYRLAYQVVWRDLYLQDRISDDDQSQEEMDDMSAIIPLEAEDEESAPPIGELATEE